MLEGLAKLLASRSGMSEAVTGAFVNLGTKLMEETIATVDKDQDGSLDSALSAASQLFGMRKMVQMGMACSGFCGCEDCLPKVVEVMKKLTTPETEAMAKACREASKAILRVIGQATFDPTPEWTAARASLEGTSCADEDKPSEDDETPSGCDDCSATACPDNPKHTPDVGKPEPEFPETKDETTDGPDGENVVDDTPEVEEISEDEKTDGSNPA